MRITLQLRMLLCLLLLGAVPVLPASAQQPLRGRVSTETGDYAERLRADILQRWSAAGSDQDLNIYVQGTVTPEGDDLQVEVVGDEAPAVRQGFKQALQTAVASVPRPAERQAVNFTLKVRNDGQLPACYPVRLYLNTTLTDQPGTTLSPQQRKAIESGIGWWQAAIGQYSGGKYTRVFELVDSPQEADVLLQTYQDAPDYGPYLRDSNGQTLVRVPVEYLQPGLIASGYRKWHPWQVTQQTMFQLGRLLGLDPNPTNGNVMFAGQSNYYALKTNTGATTKADINFVNSDPLHNYGGGDRTVINAQLQQVVDQLDTTRPCGAGRPVSGRV